MSGHSISRKIIGKMSIVTAAAALALLPLHTAAAMQHHTHQPIKMITKLAIPKSMSAANSLSSLSSKSSSDDSSSSSSSSDTSSQQSGNKTVLPVSASTDFFTPSTNGGLRPDGTGQVAENPDTNNGGVERWYLGEEPEDIKPYLHTPRTAGLAYQDPAGWFNGRGVAADQCVGFASSYFYALWSQKGSQQRLPQVKVAMGGDAAEDWAHAVGGHVSSVPHAGAIAGTGHDHPEPLGTNPYGHTFVVIHVLANGDIIAAEQNGLYSGGNNTHGPAANQWNYMLISRHCYHDVIHAQFFTPSYDADNQSRWQLNW